MSEPRCADPECCHPRSEHKGNGRGGCEVVTESKYRSDVRYMQCVCTKFRKTMPLPIDMGAVLAKIRALPAVPQALRKV